MLLLSCKYGVVCLVFYCCVNMVLFSMLCMLLLLLCKYGVVVFYVVYVIAV